MKFGINVLPRDGSSDLREISKRIEAAGFESVFLPEHTHIPIHGDMHPGGPAVLDRMSRFPDPLISLTAIAAVTSSIRIGTGISLIAQHDPIAMAKRISTLDQISGGRFLLGIGSGWNRSQARNHGIDPETRWAVMREHTLALKAIWTSDEPEFHGKYVDFDPIWSRPKPLQKPHPPVIIGGEGPRVIDRVLDYGDAWGPHPIEGVLERIDELQARAREVGRDPIPVTLFNIPADLEAVERYIDAGVERCVLYITEDGSVSIEEQLAKYIDFLRAAT
jgi:probable F420-dependent oxidoreductase